MHHPQEWVQIPPISQFVLSERTCWGHMLFFNFLNSILLDILFIAPGEVSAPEINAQHGEVEYIEPQRIYFVGYIT